jgi:hypothetical protein
MTEDWRSFRELQAEVERLNKVLTQACGQVEALQDELRRNDLRSMRQRASAIAWRSYASYTLAWRIGARAEEREECA